MRRTVVILACLAAAAAGCSSGKDGTDFTGRSAAGASATTSPAPTGTGDEGEEGLGTPGPEATTEAGPKSFPMGYKATITTDDDGEVLHVTVASPRTAKGDEFIKPEKGRFLVVTVTYEALAAAQDINPFDLLVTTTAGERIQPTFGPEVGQQLNAATLNKGEKAKGSVVFDVPTKGVTGIAYAPAGQVLGTWKL